ncbi:thymidine kinase [Bacillus paramobilis]|uniref:thymidine kinase n=1 Tax=Bacillus paramobilis TaxID=2817477 RepID=UPI001BB45C01|nr:thymidine kinase [Bacillus paramobilis]HEF5065796.1 thymidine kinase [Bacillus cereus]HEF5237780.1 thymidine kinase [Bacillus cereus]
MFTVITGGMFAEKSTELQRRGKRLKRAGRKVIYVRPDSDTRYSETHLMTHDGQTVEAITVSIENPHELLQAAKDFDVVCIDEIQFFTISVVNVIKGLLLQGKTVIVAGLDLDYQAEPFLITAVLMGYAEEVVKLQAVCNGCGEEAWVSHKEDNGERIELGTDIYKPLCRKCHNKLKLQGEI